jgi:murein L,D-transpeptidase YcbB/YkuD
MNLSARPVQAERFGLVTNRLLRVLAITIAGITAASCAGTTPEPIIALPVKQAPAPSTQASLRSILMSQAQPDVLAFYQQRDFKPAWTGSKDDATTIADIRAALGKANEQGLRNADYTLPRDTSSGPGAEAARYEIALTAVVLRYARDVRTGRSAPPRDSPHTRAREQVASQSPRCCRHRLSRDALAPRLQPSLHR